MQRYLLNCSHEANVCMIGGCVTCAIGGCVMCAIGGCVTCVIRGCVMCDPPPKLSTSQCGEVPILGLV